MDQPSAEADGLRAFYERYIAAFNAHDEAAFFDCFNLPVGALRLPSAAGDPAATAPRTITDPAALWPTLPPTWTRSTIDDVRIVADEAFAPRAGFVERTPRRAALEVTVTRWAGETPYEQVHVLYLLTNEDGHLGIKTMIPLAIAHPTSALG